MRHLTRSTLVALLALQLVGCRYWQGRPGDIREVLADPDVRHVRLTGTDGRQTEARVAEIRGDTIYGTRGSSSPISCDSASPACTLRMPIETVGFVESRSFSGIKTAALVIVPVGAILLFALGDGGCGPPTPHSC
jgi:hypothetical protein